MLASMKPIPFQLLGFLLFAFEGLILCLLVDREFWTHVNPVFIDPTRIGLFFVIFSVVAMGLIYTRRWAAVTVSLLFTALAVRVYYEIYVFNFGEQLIGASCTILLLIPLVATIKYWSVLRPGGKWYL